MSGRPIFDFGSIRVCSDSETVPAEKLVGLLPLLLFLGRLPRECACARFHRLSRTAAAYLIVYKSLSLVGTQGEESKDYTERPATRKFANFNLKTPIIPRFSKRIIK